MATPARKIAAAIRLDTNGQSVKASLTPMIAEAKARASSRDEERMRKKISNNLEGMRAMLVTISAYTFAIILSYIGNLVSLFITLPIGIFISSIICPKNLQKKFLNNMRLYMDRLAGIFSGVSVYFIYKFILNSMDVIFNLNTIIFMAIFYFISSLLYVSSQNNIDRKTTAVTNSWWKIGTIITLYINQ